MNDDRKSYLNYIALYEMCMEWREKVSNTDVSKTCQQVYFSCPILIGSKVYQSSDAVVLPKLRLCIYKNKKTKTK